MPALYYLLSNILLVFTWPERLVLLLDMYKNLRLKTLPFKYLFKWYLFTYLFTDWLADLLRHLSRLAMSGLKFTMQTGLARNCDTLPASASQLLQWLTGVCRHFRYQRLIFKCVGKKWHKGTYICFRATIATDQQNNAKQIIQKHYFWSFSLKNNIFVGVICHKSNEIKDCN